MNLIKVLPESLKNGDLIMPPERELSLWMRRDARDKNLAEDALLLKVLEIETFAKVDKRGNWIRIHALYSEAFTAYQTRPYPQGREFKFLVLPTTHIKKLEASK